MSTIKISDLTSSGAIVGNVFIPVVSNVAGTWTTLKGTVDQLKTFIVASAEANITLANATMTSYVDDRVTTANVGMIGYVDSVNTAMTSYVNGQITAANAGVTSANVGMKGYVDSTVSGNVSTLLSYVNGQITAANAGVTSANVGMVGYVNQSNSSMKSYVDGQITAANAGVTSANVGMKGYVDNQTYSNVNVSTYLPTYSGNIASVTIPPSGVFIAYGNLYIANTFTPTSNSSTGITGQITYDGDYVYICVGTDTWKRANLTSW